MMDFEKVFKSIKAITLMGKEGGAYFILAVLVGVVFFLAYSFDLKLTGFAVFDEAVSGFNGARENVVHNGSALILDSGQTSGTYTSEIFDANASTQWDTLSWQGGIPGAYSVFLISATHNGVGVTEVASQDEDYYLADMGNSSNFNLDFSENLDSGSVLKIYAKKNINSSGGAIGIYAQSDSSGTNPLGGFTVTSDTGEWINATLTLTNSTDAIWLGEGSGSGTGLQAEFDYIFAENDPQADLTFQVRNCDSSDCANVSFADADLSDINLLGQYFQYKAFFSSSDSSLSPFLENVVINSSIGIVSATITEPNGTKSSQAGIPIDFAVTGINLNCWYNVDNGANVTLAGCIDSSFDVADDGNYVFNLYANNSLGAFDHQSSSFSVDTPAPTSSSSDDDEESSSSLTTTPEFVETVKLTAEELQSLTMSPGETRQLSWNVKNVWTFPLQECNFESIGALYTWIPYLENKTLEAGEDHTFNFDINVPEETELGEYNLGVTLKCPGTGKSSLFFVDVVAPTEVEEVSAETGANPTVGGFAIFGEDGIGTGEIIIVVIVVLALVAVLFVARMMRKTGKTLKDVFNELEFKLKNFNYLSVFKRS